MRTVVVQRHRLRQVADLHLPGGRRVPTETVADLLDEAGVPDGFPFVVDDDGDPGGCWSVNLYLLAAHAQRALLLDSMRKFHVYHLARLLRFVRRLRARSGALGSGMSLEAWLAAHGEPSVDLTDVAQDELIAYRDARKPLVEPSTINTEMGCISAFYSYAAAAGWTTTDVVPRWRGRNTLMVREHRVRRARFLTSLQTTHFLEVGLRGDGAAPPTHPSSPQRDYTYGLTLATSGLRREEAALLLDIEVPTSAEMPTSGLHTFDRSGKGGVVREVHFTSDLVREVDRYRVTERASAVERHQRSLRRRLQSGKLLVVDGARTERGLPFIWIDGHKRPAVRLSDEDRARAVRINDDGTLEPLGLFIGTGLPLCLGYWNQLFKDARDRVFERGGPHQPPAHITVSPHTLRHSFAVAALAKFMAAEGKRTGDPYKPVASAMLTVKRLLGHASLETTQIYLYAAEHWNDELPSALRSIAAETVGDRNHDGRDV